jgi:hypothetical protein
MALLSPVYAMADKAIQSSFTYDVDLRDGSTERNSLGVDFDFLYALSRSTNKLQGHHFDLSVDGAGHKDFGEGDPALDLIEVGVTLRGFYYRRNTKAPLSPTEIRRYLELADIPDTLQTDKQYTEFARLDDKLNKSNPRYISYDFHYKQERNQQLGAQQHILGGGVSAELPLLHSLLDIIPAASRGDSALVRDFVVQPIRFYIGIDLVTGATLAERDNGSDAVSFSRVVGEVAWSTLILQRQILKVVGQIHYLPNAPMGFEELDREFSPHIEVKLVIPLDGKLGLVLKYADGYLPPEYSQGMGGFVGINYYID